MATDTDDTGFLSRWSRRKAQVRQGVAVPATPVLPAVQAAPINVAPAPALSSTAEPEPAPAPPPPTLADVAALTRDSDYSRFVGASVQPEVRNAALGKLFSDPHFNIMDGLDTYIDDYGKPDPLPAGMLRQMMQSHMLGLFDDEKADATGPQTATATALPPPSDTAVHENPDLQLQPVDDAGRPGPAPGAVQDNGRAH